MRLLLVNPNASAHITARMASSAQDELLPADELVTVTNTAGPAVVRSAALLAEAEAAIPSLMQPHVAACDAFVLGISLDGVIDRLRPAWGCKPALGMTEAAIACAAHVAPRVGLLTLGQAMVPLYEARLNTLLPPARNAGVAAAEMERAFGHQPGVDDELLQLLVDAAQVLPADAYVLAGAVLCGYDRALQAALGRPVFDGIRCAVRMARSGPLGCREVAHSGRTN